jgi:hypothetical protein
LALETITIVTSIIICIGGSVATGKIACPRNIVQYDPRTIKNAEIDTKEKRSGKKFVVLLVVEFI